MPKVKIKLDSKELSLINRIIESSSTSVTPKAKSKATVILMRHQGKDINSIIKQTKLSKRTVINYTNQYVNAKSKGMFFHYRGERNQSELINFIDEIRNEFDRKPPLTYKQAVDRVEMVTGIRRSETQIRNFLNKNNIYTDHTRAKLKYNVKRRIILDANKYREELRQQKRPTIDD